MNNKNTAHNLYELDNRWLFDGIKENFNVSTINELLFKPNEVIEVIEYWQKRKMHVCDDAKAVCDIEISRLEAILLRLTDVNADVMSINSEAMASRIDAIGTDQSMPFEKTKDSKTVSLLNGEKIIEIPEFKDLTRACINLIKKNRKEVAIDLATKHLAEAKYIPKDKTKKPHKWTDKEIQSWLKDLYEKISEEVKPTEVSQKEQKTKQHNEVLKRKALDILDDANIGVNKIDQIANAYKAEKIVDLQSYKNHLKIRETLRIYDFRDSSKVIFTEDDKKAFDLLLNIDTNNVIRHSTSDLNKLDAIIEFGTPKLRLREELEAFDRISGTYIELYEKSKEEEELKQKADDLIEIFFRFRGYSTNQIDKWKQTIVEKEISDLDHFETLGIPSIISGGRKELVQYEDSFENLRAKLGHELVQGLKNNNGDPETSIKQTIDEYEPKLSNTYILNAENIRYNMYTPIHVIDFIRRTMNQLMNEFKITEESEFRDSILESIRNHIPLNLILDSTFMKLVQDGLYKQKDGKVIDFRDLNKLKEYTTEVYDEIIKNMRPDGIEKAVTKKEFYDFILENKSKSVEDIIDSEIVERIFDNNGLIRSNTDNIKLTYKIAQFKHLKNLSKHVQSILDDLNKKPSKDDLTLTRASEIFPKAKNLVDNYGYSEEMLVDWAKEQILENEKFDKEKSDKSLFKNEEKIKLFINQIYGRFFSEEIASETIIPNVKPIDKDKIKEIAKTGSGFVSIIKNVREYLSKNGITMNLSEIRDNFGEIINKVRPRVIEENKKAIKETVNEIESVDEPIDDIPEAEIVEDDQEIIYSNLTEFEKEYPDIWEKVKKFNKLDQVYNFTIEREEALDIKTAIEMCIKLIVENKQIEDAEGWNVDQVTHWFNKTFSSKNESGEEFVPEDVNTVSDTKTGEDQETVKTVPLESGKKEDKSKNVPLDYDVTKAINAVNKTQYKDAVLEILKKYGTNKSVRTAIVDAIRKHAVGKYARQISKNNVYDLYKAVDKQAKFIDGNK